MARASDEVGDAIVDLAGYEGCITVAKRLRYCVPACLWQYPLYEEEVASLRSL
jgi:hypothetical protein